MTLQDDLLALAALDRRVRAMIGSGCEGLKDALIEYQALRTAIRTHLLALSVVSVGSIDAVTILQKITTGEGLPTDKVIKQLHSASGLGHPLDEFGEDELEALGSSLLYSWFSHFEYIEGLAELRPLVVNSSVRESVAGLVRQIKDCYAFQQYDAVYSLCRTVIEASSRDICVRRHLFSDLDEDALLFDKISWSKLRDEVSSDLLRQQLTSLYADLSVVLHGRKSVSQDEARRAVEDTLQIIEQLYAAHGL